MTRPGSTLRPRRGGGLFAGSTVEARVVSSELGAAPALKLAFAAWTTGTAALLITIRALAALRRPG